MRRLLVFVLVLGLLLGLAACGLPQDEEPTLPNITSTPTAQTQPTMRAAKKMAQEFQALWDREGQLPDEDVLAFVYALESECEGLNIYQSDECLFAIYNGITYYCYPDYRAIQCALNSTLSSRMSRWLWLKAQEKDWKADEDLRRMVPAAHDLRMAKAWFEFETEYPGFSDGSSADWAERYLQPASMYLSNVGEELTDEERALYTTKQKASAKEFLSDEANREYPFYDAVYQFINQ